MRNDAASAKIENPKSGKSAIRTSTQTTVKVRNPPTLPDAMMRQKIASAVVAIALEHEEIGLPLKKARAAHGRLNDQVRHARDRDRDDGFDR